MYYLYAYAGSWGKDHIKKIDTIRMLLVCEVMAVDSVESIYNAALQVLDVQKGQLHK